MKKILTILLAIAFLFLTTTVKATTLNCDQYLSYNSIGEEVKILQTKLNEQAMCNLEVDGIIGSQTSACIKRYQSLNNLAIDGIVGPKTCAKLNTNKPLNTKNKGITTANVNVRTSPNTTSQIIKTLPQGTIITIKEKVNDYYKVKLNSKTTGYLHSNYLTENAIVIDLSRQMLYFYQDKKLKLQAPVVTGTKNSHDTPTGNYLLKIANLEKNRTLRGTNDDGSSYSAFVTYWMPFITDRGIGLHDATWRSIDEFTKDRYLNNGSHGCVNLQYQDAEYIFTNLTTDINVIIRN